MHVILLQTKYNLLASEKRQALDPLPHSFSAPLSLKLLHCPP